MKLRPGEDVVVLRVLGGNTAARRHLGRDLLLQVGRARLVARDRNGDGRRDIADLRELDPVIAWVRVEDPLDARARLPVRRLELAALSPVPTPPGRGSSR